MGSGPTYSDSPSGGVASSIVQIESELILSTLAMLKEQTPEGVIDMAKVKKGKAN